MRVPLRVSDLDGTCWEVELHVARSMSGKGVDFSFGKALCEITNSREFEKAVDSVVDSSGGGALGRYKAPDDGHEVGRVRLW
jgi:hypothetical protein